MPEGLGDVVVGAGIERVDLVGTVTPPGQHQDRRLGGGAKLEDDLDPIEVREPKVEYDEVRGLRGGRLPARYGASSSARANSIRPVGMFAFLGIVNDGALSVTHDPPHAPGAPSWTDSATKSGVHKGRPTQEMAEAPEDTRLREASDPGRLVP